MKIRAAIRIDHCVSENLEDQRLLLGLQHYTMSPASLPLSESSATPSKARAIILRRMIRSFTEQMSSSVIAQWIH
ncbi:hypothetical protein UF78_04435 [Stutzerimonas stutzeri]|uniref:Uncharacterized protein n=1 Tax=Stutzerimonas stutzeri TaxID=316 RepID=A0A0D9AVC4_STUST|nr:hypothetical protein UF78_04435 [Stutzerimonas stutzeri]